MSSEQCETARSALALRVLFRLLAFLAICGTPLGAGNGWAAVPDLARTLGPAEPHALAKVESDKSCVGASILLSVASASEAGDDVFVEPPQFFSRLGDVRDRAPAFAPLDPVQRTRSFDSQAPPAAFSFV